MVLIFGGAYQGKLAYALERFNLTESDVHKLDKWILELIQTNQNVEEEVQKFIKTNPDAVIICNDISCGVVPVDPLMRRWREETGKALARLSRESDEVIRLFCGIAERVK